jgi:hypothetical protein
MVLLVLIRRCKGQYWRLLCCCQASFYQFLSPVALFCHAMPRHCIDLTGVIDWQRRRLVAGDDSGFGFGLSGFGEKCY